MPQSEIAGLREDLHRHQDQDERNFVAVRNDIREVAESIAEWSGALQLAKWATGLGIPSIFMAVVTHVVRHW